MARLVRICAVRLFVALFVTVINCGSSQSHHLFGSIYSPRQPVRPSLHVAFPSSISKCDSSQFKCHDGLRCIQSSFVCDKDRDCLDNSDENNCGVTHSQFIPSPFGKEYLVAETPGSFLDTKTFCAQHNASLPIVLTKEEEEWIWVNITRRTRYWLGLRNTINTHFFREWIDGTPLNRSNWEGEEPDDYGTCSAVFVGNTNKWFNCLCPRCLHVQMVCERYDSSSEVVPINDQSNSTVVQCNEGQFKCANGSACVPQHYRCDGQYDCEDTSDELNCVIPINGFTSSPFGKEYALLAPKSLVEAEKACNVLNSTLPILATREEQDWIWLNIAQRTRYWLGLRNGAYTGNFSKWLDGSSVNFEAWADNQPDEAKRCTGVFVGTTNKWYDCDCTSCSNVRTVCMRDPLLTNISSISFADEGLKCNIYQFMCKDGTKCVPKRYVCDLDKDCGDNSDESNCPAICVGSQFKCANGRRCISPYMRCDKDNDCGDNSDELDCEPLSCTASEFKCADERKCISISSICDGDNDCRDTSDEAHCDFKLSPFGKEYLLGFRKTLIGAELFCAGKNSILPILSSKEEQDWIWTNVTHKALYWLGLRNEPHTKRYRKWIDGSLVNFTVWDTKRPDALGKCLGVYVNDKSKWFDCSCTGCSYVRTVCMRDSSNRLITNISLATTPKGDNCDDDQFRCKDGRRCIPLIFRCDASYDCADLSDERNCSMFYRISPITGHSYFLDVARNYTSAEQFCLSHNLSLPRIDSRLEQEWILTFVARRRDFWVAAESVPLTSDFFGWKDGSKFKFIDWSHSEPNDLSNCSAMYVGVTNKWFDCDCDHCNTVSTICMKEVKRDQSALSVSSSKSSSKSTFWTFLEVCGLLAICAVVAGSGFMGYKFVKRQRHFEPSLSIKFIGEDYLTEGDSNFN